MIFPPKIITAKLFFTSLFTKITTKYYLITLTHLPLPLKIFVNVTHTRLNALHLGPTNIISNVFGSRKRESRRKHSCRGMANQISIPMRLIIIVSYYAVSVIYINLLCDGTA